MTPWHSVKFSLATAEDLATLHSFDHTKLSAVNTCPTWGIIRYGHHKSLSGGRAMALEAGAALHECFAAIRLVQLGHVQQLPEHMHHHGGNIFGADRWQSIIGGWNAADASITMRNAALECLATANYVDDPFDKRRTYVNLETSLLYYCQRWEPTRYPIWVSDNDVPTSRVGVEIPFAMRIDVFDADGAAITSFIYTGRIDGLHTNDRDGELIVQENKTASRLDSAWQMSFDVSHQVTGYCVAASVYSQSQVERAMVIGLTIPLPRTMSDGMAVVPVRRLPHMKHRWVMWLEHTIPLFMQHYDDPLTAPRYTHSCNRYFRPCSFIPLCTADEDEQRVILDEMVLDEWSPLHDKAGD